MRQLLSPNAALVEMLAKDAEAGVDVFDHGPRPASWAALDSVRAAIAASGTD